MTSANLIEDLSNKSNRPQEQCFAMVETMSRTIADWLSDDNEVILRNFGVFKKRPSRVSKTTTRGIAPHDRVRVTFRPTKKLILAIEGDEVDNG